MLVVLSPAKQLNFSILRSCLQPTLPQFIAQAEEIVSSTLASQSTTQLGKTLKISSNLASLNSARYTNFQTGSECPAAHQDGTAACAVTAYSGRAWQGLDQSTLSDKELLYCNATLRIISGLYGLLRPSDIIQPYRLDMGTKVQVQDSKNLYSFWGAQLKDSLLSENPEIIVNVASNEYWKACLEKELAATTRVVNVAFREGQGSGARVIAVHAKLARGKFVRFMCQQQPKTVADLQSFTGDIGYKYDHKLSQDNELVFTRRSGSGSGSSSSSKSKSESKSKTKGAKKRSAAKKTTTVAESAKKKSKKK